MVEELRQVIWNFLWALPLAQVRFCGKGGQGGLCYGTSEANGSRSIRLGSFDELRRQVEACARLSWGA